MSKSSKVVMVSLIASIVLASAFAVVLIVYNVAIAAGNASNADAPNVKVRIDIR